MRTVAEPTAADVGQGMLGYMDWTRVEGGQNVPGWPFVGCG